MPKATSVKPGSSASAPRQATSTERKATKVVESARVEAARVRAKANADAARVREEAEEHAHRLVVDARATADGVRAEGMEVVSSLRQISDTLRDLSDRVLQDVEAIHARTMGELQRVAPADAAAEEEPIHSAPAEDDLDVPDFVQPQ